MSVDLTALMARLENIDERIRLKTFELECAEMLSDDHLTASDAGWIFSIFEGTAGTLLAVLNGQESNEWGGEVTRIRDELAALSVDRRLLERELDAALDTKRGQPTRRPLGGRGR